MTGDMDVVYSAEDTASGQYVKIRVAGSHAPDTGPAGFTRIFAVNQKKRRKCWFPSKGGGESRISNVPLSSAFCRTHGLGRAISIGMALLAVCGDDETLWSKHRTRSECVILRTGGQSSCCAASQTLHALAANKSSPPGVFGQRIIAWALGGCCGKCSTSHALLY